MEAATPTVSHAIKSEISPILDAPPTEFPYPDSNDETHRRTQRLESESTLCEEGDHARTDGKEAPKNPKELQTPSRPHLSVSKFATEISRPVAQRPVAPLPQRRSMDAKQMTDPQPAKHSLSSDSSSTSEDEQHATRRKRSHHDALSKSKLNRTRMRPSRTISKFDNDGRFTVGNEHFKSKGKVAGDGRLDISVNETANSGYLAKAFGGTIQRHLEPQREHEARATRRTRDNPDVQNSGKIPRLNIVIMVIGSRGDIQPFLKIGKILKDKYNHRVRIATHPTFKQFVEDDIGLEFFSVGGNPSELMSFMVKNPGLIPSLETIKEGEIGRRRDSMFEMFQGFWRACVNATDDETDYANLRMMGQKHPFIADAIIANPPSFAHFHCAERLGIPLHLVFTFPYTPTQAFPHPLANIKTTNVDQAYTNYMSYPLVELMTWQGLGDLVNRFREKTLGLQPMSTLWAPGQISRLKVPMTYLWSPGLVPKPADWGPEINIAGYVFLDLASSFKAPEPLTEFLQQKDDRKIVYIGFGSISGIDDPLAFTKMIFDAVELAGVRALVSKGWGGMGDGMDVPDSVFLLDNIPHDWLFPQVDAVVHHGGAGTTAIGLKCGKPTMIVPFFGDQPFWSAMIVKAGAGAKESLSLKQLDAEKFAQGIRECLTPDAKAKAEELAKSIEAEGDGAENAVNSFHQSLPLETKGSHSMRCGIFEDRVAVWKVKNTKMHLSALAADLLVENKQLKWDDLKLVRHYEWNDFQGPGEPITGAGGAAVASLQEAIHGLSSITETTKRDMKRYERAKRKRQGRTVTDAVAKAGRAAHAARGMQSLEAARLQHAETAEDLNFHDQAEPPKFSVLTAGEGRPHPLTRTTTDRILATPAPVTILKDVSHGLGHFTKAVVEMPLDIWIALTLGFRNAPRLYGDTTVRPPPNTITGARSGFKAAGSELYLGFYDGIIGVVQIPYLDTKRDGMVGLPKGVARGVGGLILKPISGMLGLGAYSAVGMKASIRKRFRDTTRTERWIRRARMTQGAKDVQEYGAKSKPAGVHPARASINQRSNELEEVRTRALTQWSSHERVINQEQAKESKEKRLEKRMSLVPNLAHRDKKGKGLPRASTSPP